MKYNAEKDLEYINDQLSMYMHIVGLNGESIDLYSIDEVINAARSITDVPISEVESGELDLNNDELYLFLLSQRIAIVGNIRRLWYMRQLALAAVTDAV